MSVMTSAMTSPIQSNDLELVTLSGAASVDDGARTLVVLDDVSEARPNLVKVRRCILHEQPASALRIAPRRLIDPCAADASWPSSTPGRRVRPAAARVAPRPSLRSVTSSDTPRTRMGMPAPLNWARPREAIERIWPPGNTTR
jgi:hypothetical protein